MTTPHEQALRAIHEEACERYRNKDTVSPLWIMDRTEQALAATPEPAQAVEPSEDAKRTLANPPERIYLQVGDVDSDFPGEIHWRDVTWSDEQVDRSDLVYLRQPAPMVRLTAEELEAVFNSVASFRSWSFTWPQQEFANAIMDAMIAKNGGKP